MWHTPASMAPLPAQLLAPFQGSRAEPPNLRPTMSARPATATACAARQLHIMPSQTAEYQNAEYFGNLAPMLLCCQQSSR